MYHSKWDAGTWNDRLGPICDTDLKDINKMLIDKFGDLKDEVIRLIPDRNKITERLIDKFYRKDYNR